jgi:uncharacterized protein involved in exopolysaccharide biosynthesis
VSEQRDDQNLKDGGAPLPGPYPPPYWYLPPESRDDEIRLADLWNIAIANRRLILGATLLCTLLAVAYAVLATPIYRADTLLAPVEDESKTGLAALAERFGGLADLAGLSLSEGGDVETALATLESRDFLTRFIREEEIKPILFPDDWNTDTRSWIPSDPGLLDKIKGSLGLRDRDIRDSSLAPGEPTDWDAFELFSEDVLDVSTNSKTGLVKVIVEWDDPRLAAHWANLLVERINAQLRQQAVQREQKSIEYLREQIDQTSLTDLRAVLFRLVEEHTKTMTLAKVNEEYVFQVIDPAVVPQEKARPVRSLIVFAGVILGFVLGIMFTLARVGVASERSEAQTP